LAVNLNKAAKSHSGFVLAARRLQIDPVSLINITPGVFGIQFAEPIRNPRQLIAISVVIAKRWRQAKPTGYDAYANGTRDWPKATVATQFRFLHNNGRTRRVQSLIWKICVSSACPRMQKEIKIKR